MYVYAYRVFSGIIVANNCNMCIHITNINDRNNIAFTIQKISKKISITENPEKRYITVKSLVIFSKNLRA